MQHSMFTNYQTSSNKAVGYEMGDWKGQPQPAVTCSKLTIETLEQSVKYVQS